MSFGKSFVVPETKPPWDRFFISIDCSSWLGGDTFSSADFTAKDAEGNDVSTTVLDQAKCTYSDTTLKPYIQSGTDGQVYDVIVKATTDAGDRLSVQVTFYCQDF